MEKAGLSSLDELIEVDGSIRARVLDNIPRSLVDDPQEEDIHNFQLMTQDLEDLFSTCDLRGQTFITVKIRTFVENYPNRRVSSIYLTLLHRLEDRLGIPRFDEHTSSVSAFYKKNDAFVSVPELYEALLRGEVPSSVYIKGKSTPESLKETLSEMLYLRNGRLTNSDRVMLWFGDLLTLHRQFVSEFLLGEGPLSQDWRMLIAIMAASSVGCEYQYFLMRDIFLHSGGDPLFLTKGVSAFPPKLRALTDLIYVLAYKPWSLREDPRPVYVLLKETTPIWSINELVQALVIISYYHGISCFCLAFGLVPEVNFLKDFSRQEEEKEKEGMKELDPSFTQDLCERLRKYSAEEQDELPAELEPKIAFVEEPSDTPNKGPAVEEVKSPLIERFIGKSSGVFESFSHKNYKILKDTDFSWKNDGFSFVNQLFSELTVSLNAIFEEVNTMTTNSVFQTLNTDTSALRKAINMYAKDIFGIKHANYPYKKINRLMAIPLKTFIKRSVTVPANITNIDYGRYHIYSFPPTEVAHVLLLVQQARIEAELIYGILAAQSVLKS